ncbi:hypothetical protein [Bacillus sinesaloumensis]|uniref:hypothetical protein n=1 Tax=Litchfieldia sinesaloumensis TaxID=1926280 RepID=UPI001356464F|nr:hypothetical protein [Bacillus sinesaloumensis]
MELYLKKIEENGYDTMKKLRLFTTRKEEIRQNNVTVHKMKDLINTSTLIEEGRGQG